MHKTTERTVMDGALIRQKREELGLSQETLARLIGVERSVLSRYETGQRKTIPEDAAERIRQILKIEPMRSIRMQEGKIHIRGYRSERKTKIVTLSDAANAIVSGITRETGLPACRVVSDIIEQSQTLLVFDDVYDAGEEDAT